MNVLRTLKINQLNGRFNEKEKFFFSQFNNLVEDDRVIKKFFYPKNEYAVFIHNLWSNIFWIEYDYGFAPFLKRYNLNPLEAKKLITKMLKKQLGINVRLSTNLPEEFERYYTDFCNNEA